MIRPSSWIGVLLWLAATVVVPQEQAAMLTQGPRLVAGIAPLGPNRLPATWGQYRWGTRVIDVAVTGQEAFIPDDWQPLACGPLAVQAGLDPRGLAALAVTVDAATLYFFHPSMALREASWEALAVCPLVQRFVDRYRYFRNFISNPSDQPLPAILEL